MLLEGYEQGAPMAWFERARSSRLATEAEARKVDTEISRETANKIAVGLAGVAAGTVVRAVGAAIGNGDVIKAGGASPW